MKHSLLFSAALAALVLTACEKPTAVPPPKLGAPPGGTGLTGSLPAPISISPSSSTDTALPAIKPVTPGDLPTGSQSKPNPQGSMTKQEESMAMPKPGQANDHSTPVLNPPVK